MHILLIWRIIVEILRTMVRGEIWKERLVGRKDKNIFVVER